ncbi:MAG TPA: hypothetical protein VHV82_02515 [Sporichthyaceae bacterium]|jgi:hypothetical protein|nr:hypothetical protein [Sporichthyaceae bacterium]
MSDEIEQSSGPASGRVKYDDLFTPAQNLAIAALAVGGTDKDAAGAASVSESTIKNWRQGAPFRAEVRRQNRELTRRLKQRYGLDLLNEASKQALAILRDPTSTYTERSRIISIVFNKFSAFDASDEVTAAPMQELNAEGPRPAGPELVSLLDIYKRRLALAAEQADWPLRTAAEEFGDDDVDELDDVPEPAGRTIRGEKVPLARELPPAPQEAAQAPSPESVEQREPARVETKAEREAREAAEWRQFARQRGSIAGYIGPQAGRLI